MSRDVPANGMKECEAEGGLKLLVANAGGEFFAYQAVCPHQDVPLCEGLYDGAMLTCHQHLWQWDIRTGAPMGLAEAPLERYDLVGATATRSTWRRRARSTWAELFAGASEPTLAKLDGASETRGVRAGRDAVRGRRPGRGLLRPRLGPGRVPDRPRRADEPGRVHAAQGRGVRLGGAARQPSPADRARALPGALDGAADRRQAGAARCSRPIRPRASW